MKNILFLIGVYPNYGGTEKVTTVLANAFSERGHVVHIASFSQPVMDLVDDLNPRIVLHKLEYPVKSRKNVSSLREIITTNSIDIILNQWCLPYYTTQLCNLARKETSCKLVSVLHGIPNKSKKILVSEDALKNAGHLFRQIYCKAKLNLLHQAIKFSLRYVYKHSDHYVVLSKSFISTFQEYSNVKDSQKICSISNPISIELSDNEDCFISGKCKQVLYVGRMDYENKRVNRIIEAWESLFEQYKDWELILVGDGPHRVELNEYVAAKKIERVTFTGFVKEDPIKFYRDASILMLTSDLEGFGLVIVEGMAYGVVPVVYGSYEAVYDIINHGENGFITSMPYSKEETLGYLKELMNNENLRNEMAFNSKKISSQFSIVEIIKQWECLFDKLHN